MINFWLAPNEALFSQKQLAEVFGYSEAWFELMRWKGGGIPFRKLGGRCLYQKEDVLIWIEKHPKCDSTSEYQK